MISELGKEKVQVFFMLVVVCECVCAHLVLFFSITDFSGDFIRFSS